MKKLVLGTTKTVVVPAILKEKQPSIDALNVTPSTSAQTITAPSGTDGYSPVNVSAVTSSIDANIQAGNIKDGVTILGVTGNYQGGGSAPAHYIEKSVDANGKLVNGSTFIDLTGVTDVGDSVLAYSYLRSSFGIATINFNSLTSVSGTNSFLHTFDHTNVRTVDFSGIVSISGTSCFSGTFSDCSSLESVDFSNLETISGGQAFYQTFVYSTLSSINFSKLKTISAANVFVGTFGNCTQLTSIDFNSLENIGVLAPSYGIVFKGCKNLGSVSFGGVKASTFANIQNQFQYLFDSTTGSTAPNGCTVHFPSNLDPSDPDHTFDASTLTGYPTFGGNANYIHVAFDLPATE